MLAPLVVELPPWSHLEGSGKKLLFNSACIGGWKVVCLGTLHLFLAFLVHILMQLLFFRYGCFLVRLYVCFSVLEVALNTSWGRNTV